MKIEMIKLTIFGWENLRFAYFYDKYWTAHTELWEKKAGQKPCSFGITFLCMLSSVIILNSDKLAENKAKNHKKFCSFSQLFVMHWKPTRCPLSWNVHRKFWKEKKTFSFDHRWDTKTVSEHPMEINEKKLPNVKRGREGIKKEYRDRVIVQCSVLGIPWRAFHNWKQYSTSECLKLFQIKWPNNRNGPFN